MKQPETVTVRRSVKHMLAYLLAFPIFAVVSCSLLFRSQIWIGIVVMISALFFLVIGFIGTRDRSSQVVLDGNGLFVRELQCGHIPWRSIRSVRLESMPRGVSFIVLEIKDDEVKSLRFHAHGLDVSPETLCSLISGRIL